MNVNMVALGEHVEEWNEMQSKLKDKLRFLLGSDEELRLYSKIKKASQKKRFYIVDQDNPIANFKRIEPLEVFGDPERSSGEWPGENEIYIVVGWTVTRCLAGEREQVWKNPQRCFGETCKK